MEPILSNTDSHQSLKELLVQTFKIGVPTAISVLSINFIEFINLAFIGHIGNAASIVGVGLGNTLLNVTCMTIRQGVEDALNTFLSQAYGAGNMILCKVHLN
jgi:Na+-driven multidrug efflux pump